MKYYSNRWTTISKTMFLALGMFVGACANEDITEYSDYNKPSMHQEQPEEKQVSVSLDLSGVVDTDLPVEVLPEHNTEDMRAYTGLAIDRSSSKLHPLIKGTAKVLVILASTKNSKVYKEMLEWTYDEKNKKLVSVKGQGKQATSLLYTAPQALLNAGNLRMMLMLLPDGVYQDSQGVVNMNTYADGERIVEEENNEVHLKIPYFSNWASVNFKNNHLKLKEGETFRFAPQGRVLKIDVTNKQSRYTDLHLRGIALQTNVMSMFGTYDLKSIKVNSFPAWVAKDAEVMNSVDGKPSKREISRRSVSNSVEQVPQGNYVVDLAEDISLPKGVKKTFYTWFMPTSIFKRGDTPMTRLFLRAARPGDTNKKGYQQPYAVTPVYHTRKHEYSKRGAKVAVSIIDPMVVSPIETFSPTRLVTTLFPYYGRTETEDYARKGDKWALNMIEYHNEARSQRATIRFSSVELYDKSFYGQNKGKEKDGTTWYLPYLNEMRALIPINVSAIDPVFKISSASGTKVSNVSEPDVRLYGVGTSGSENYTGSYYRMPTVVVNSNQAAWLGGVQIAALRFMKNGDNRLKTAFVFELAPLTGRPSNGNSTQYHYTVTTYYLGDHYPEIQTAEDFYRYKNEVADNIYWRRYVRRMVTGVAGFSDMIRMHLNTDDLVNNRHAVIADDNGAPRTVRLNAQAAMRRDYGVYLIKH